MCVWPRLADRIWEVLHTLRGHSKFVYSVSASADATRIASGSGDNTVRGWDVKSGEPLLVLQATRTTCTRSTSLTTGPPWYLAP